MATDPIQNPKDGAPAAHSAPPKPGNIPAKPAGKNAAPVAKNREALGLSAAKPSEMVAGLDQVVARAEKQEAREQQKKKAGGNTLNMALHVDDTGQRWRRQIVLAVVGVVLIGGGLFAYLVYRTNKKELAPREGNEMARQRIEELRTLAAKYPFPDDEPVTLEAAKAKLSKAIDEELAGISEQLVKDAENKRPIDRRATELRDRLTVLKGFKDPWDQAFEMEISPEEKLIVTVLGKPNADGSRMKPFEITLKSGKRR